MNEASAILRTHGGRIDAAAKLYPAAPQPWIDLSTGINPRPYPVPLVAPELWQRLPLARDLDDLLAAAADYYGAPAGLRLLPVPGSDSAIRLLPRLVRAHRVGVLGPTYSSHAEAWTAAGCLVDHLGALPDAGAGLDGVVLVNPNNPDGRRHSAADLLDWAGAWTAAGHWLIVDEAFADVDPEASLLTRPALPPRILVLRSLGKFFGLAGLRLGFIVAPERVAARWQPLVGDWPVSGPAAAIGAAGCGRTSRRPAARRLAADRARLDAVLAGSGFIVRGGTDLFRLAEAPAQLPAGLDLLDHFACRGILVRGFDAFPRRIRFGLPGGEAAAWQRLAQACRELNSTPS